MNPLSKFLKGPVVVEQAGPASYAAGGFQVQVGNFRVVKIADVYIKDDNTPYKVGEVSISGNNVTVKVYKLSADTTTGEISTAEATGDDLSGITFKVVAYGY